jgi:hypothetical protein
VFLNGGDRDLESLAFFLNILSHFWIASSFVYSLHDVMVGSLLVATTAVSSAKVSVVISCEDGRPAVYSRYGNGLRTLPWGMPAFAGKSYVCPLSILTRKCLLCRKDFRIRK